MIQSGQARYRSKTRCVDPFWPRHKSGNKSNQGPRKFDPPPQKKKNPAGFNSAKINGGRRIITGSTRTQKKRSSRAYICIYYLPVCYCFAIPCCPMPHSISGRIVERILRPIHVRTWEGYRKTSMRLLSQAGLHRQLYPEIVNDGPLRNKCVHICLPPSTWEEDYIKSYLDGDSFFSGLESMCSTFCPIALASLRRAQQLPNVACLLSGCPVIDVVVLLLYPSF